MVPFHLQWVWVTSNYLVTTPFLQCDTMPAVGLCLSSVISQSSTKSAKRVTIKTMLGLRHVTKDSAQRDCDALNWHLVKFMKVIWLFIMIVCTTVISTTLPQITLEHAWNIWMTLKVTQGHQKRCYRPHGTSCQSSAAACTTSKILPFFQHKWLLWRWQVLQPCCDSWNRDQYSF